MLLKLPLLRYLGLIGASSLSKTGVACLAEHPKLSSLSFQRCRGRFGDGFWGFKRRGGGISRLFLDGCPDAGDISSVSGLGISLQELVVRKNTHIPCNALSLVLFSAPRIVSLVLAFCSVTDKHLTVIGDATNCLKTLCVSHGCGLSDAGIAYVSSKNRGLRHFDISYNPLVTQKSLNAVREHCLYLEFFDYSGCF